MIINMNIMNRNNKNIAKKIYNKIYNVLYELTLINSPFH